MPILAILTKTKTGNKIGKFGCSTALICLSVCLSVLPKGTPQLSALPTKLPAFARFSIQGAETMAGEAVGARPWGLVGADLGSGTLSRYFHRNSGVDTYFRVSRFTYLLTNYVSLFLWIDLSIPVDATE